MLLLVPLASQRSYAARVGTKEQWRRQVNQHFGFLGDYGYSIVRVDDSTFWEVAVTYAHCCERRNRPQQS
jgi:hypothetical protein